MPTPDVEVEDYRTYYAICYTCGWEGGEHEDDSFAAQRDADEHECPVHDADERPDGIMPPPMFDVEADS